MSSEPESLKRHEIEPVSIKTAALALLTVALWGANPAAVSYSVDTLPPIAVAALRFAMATVFMLFWCYVEGCGLKLHNGQRGPALIAGILLFLQIATFNVGVTMSNSSHASMMINTFVFWVVVIEHFITKADRLSSRKLIGLCVAFGGVLLLLLRSDATAVVASRDQPTLVGDAILMCSAGILAWKVIYVRYALKFVEPGKLIFWHDLVGVICFVICSASLESVKFGGFTTPAVLALIYQGVFVAGICFALQAVLLRHHSASQIAIFSFATPLFGVGTGILLRGDQMTPMLVVAAVCVAIGILLVNLKKTVGVDD
ncbi:MAG: DMT family transporter [Planctomycetaceae bacterium]|nr:DMT family transporter [Planctomycetales bacterium]MCB9923241.1 DMT family transporter [Planctomycetaceae bacterium]